MGHSEGSPGREVHLKMTEIFQINNMVGYKTSLNKFKKIEIISSSFLDHNGLKLEINLKEKTQKHSNTWETE